MRSAVAISLVSLALLCACAGSLHARSTGFEDLLTGANFQLGETFVSNGINFEIVEGVSNDPLGNGRVLVRSSASNTSLFSGNKLLIGPSTGLSINLPVGVRQLVFSFGDTAASALTVNGVGTPFPGHLPSSDGQSLGGVLTNVESFPIGTNPNLGRVTLTGPIQSLVLNGAEMGIDNLSFVVPEPSTIVLLLVFLGPFIERRLRDVK